MWTLGMFCTKKGGAMYAGPDHKWQEFLDITAKLGMVVEERKPGYCAGHWCCRATKTERARPRKGGAYSWRVID